MSTHKKKNITFFYILNYTIDTELYIAIMLNIYYCFKEAGMFTKKVNLKRFSKWLLPLCIFILYFISSMVFFTNGVIDKFFPISINFQFSIPISFIFAGLFCAIFILLTKNQISDTVFIYRPQNKLSMYDYLICAILAFFTSAIFSLFPHSILIPKNYRKFMKRQI